MDHLLTCPVCFDPFDSDLSLFQSEERRRHSHLPVLSHQCPHKICASCLNNWQHRAVSKRAKQLPKWFKCPCCAKRTAFDAEEMEIDTFACTMFAHVKANGVTVQQSNSEPVETHTRTQTSESFLEHGFARRTEFYYLVRPAPVADDVDQTSFVQNRTLRSTSSGASRRKRDLMSALSESKDTDEIRAMLDREDDLTSAERFLQDGASRRSMRVVSGDNQDGAELEKTCGADVWKCHCGAMNSSQRKRCPPPCFKWRPGLRTGGKKHDESEVEDESREGGDDCGVAGTIEADAACGEDLGPWECPSCKQMNPFGKKLCKCKSTRGGRGCAIPGCPKYSQGFRYNHMCANHNSNSNTIDVATPPPNPRRQGTNDASPARLKDPYAPLKRRDLPRQRSRHHCGSCDACMVDECGRCKNCLDMPRFGGSGISRQKCMNRPPCYDPPSASTAIPRAPGIVFEHSTNNNIQTQSRKRKGRNDSEPNAGVDIARNSSTDEDFARWKCDSCKLVSPFSTKPCGCRAKRRRLCVVLDCMKQSAGSCYGQYCIRHYRHRTSHVSEETPSLNSRQRGHHEKKNSCADLEHQRRTEESSEKTPEWKCQGCGKTHASERKRCPPPCRRWKNGRRTEENTGNEVLGTSGRKERHGSDGWKCPACNQISPVDKKLCDCRTTRRERRCAIPDCPKYSQGIKFNYMCKKHYLNSTDGEVVTSQPGHDSNISEAATPIVATLPNPHLRRQTESSGRRKNPFVDRKRRDSPRQRSRYCCGSCDACMVDDCGKCSHCLDMPRFGGEWIKRQKCMNRPPCYSVPSASRTLDEDFAGTIERRVHSDYEEAEGKEEEGEDDAADRLFEALMPGRYEYCPLPAGGSKEVQADDTIVTLFTTGWERGKVEDIDRASPSQKRVAKGFSVPRLVRYISDNSYWLHDLDDPAIYLSEKQFNNLNAGSTETSEGVKVGAWCVVRRTDSPRNPSPGVLV